MKFDSKFKTEADLRGARGAREGHAPPPSTPYFLQSLTFLQAGKVSISLASSKSRVSPLKNIFIAKKGSESFKF